MQAGTCLHLRLNSNVAVMWHIPPPNSNPSFEKYAIFLPVKLMTFLPMQICPEYDV